MPEGEKHIPGEAESFHWDDDEKKELPTNLLQPVIDLYKKDLLTEQSSDNLSNGEKETLKEQNQEIIRQLESGKYDNIENILGLINSGITNRKWDINLEKDGKKPDEIDQSAITKAQDRLGENRQARDAIMKYLEVVRPSTGKISNADRPITDILNNIPELKQSDGGFRELMADVQSQDPERLENVYEYLNRLAAAELDSATQEHYRNVRDMIGKRIQFHRKQGDL